MTIDPAERDERVMSLAAAALKTPPPQRAIFLQTACKNNPELFREVSDVVTWEERMSGFLSRPLIEFVDLEVETKPFKPGQTVEGRFEILGHVGDGGMGVVYEAFDAKRKERIAIKVAKPGFGRLLSPELKGALKVRHTNICMVNEIHTTKTEFGELDFLTMEFLEGETLSGKLARGKLLEAEALEIARQLCAGVAEAHHSDILHRDLKPANVILCRKKDSSTRAVITDFGLATESSAGDELRGGTPAFMAPELWRGEKASPASDVFSLGVILYEMVTGGKPFPPAAENNGAAHSPVPPSKLVKGLPRRWDKAVLPCLKSNPEERCSAEEALAALKRPPLYRTPAAAVTLTAFLGLAAVASPRIIAYFIPPPFRLAVLPVEGPGNLAQRGPAILDDVAARVRQIQAGKATVSVIPLSRSVTNGVTTPHQAEVVLGATHALQLRLRTEDGGVAVEGAVIDLKTMANVGNYSGHFSGNDLTDLPAGLTGSVAWALHIPRAAHPESVVAVAATAYKNGFEYLNREPHDYADAMPQFQDAARLDQHSPLPLAGLAEAYTREYQARRDEKARNHAQFWLARAEALDADSPRVRLTAGLLHLVQGDYPKALADYQRVEEIDPRNVDALLGSGLAFELQHLLDKATIDYRRAIAADPKDYRPHMYLGALYFSDGNYSEATAMYQQAIALASQHVDLYGSLAGAYIAQGKYREAEEVFNRSPQGAATALMLNNLGAKLAFQGQDDKAIPYYQRAVEQNPNRSIYWLNLGDSQRRLKDLVNARKSYQRGLALAQAQVTTNTANASARAYLAYLQARLGFRGQAMAQIAAALNSPARDDQVVLCAVQTYEVLGERERALAAAATATAQTRTEMNRHPDLADLQRDSRFRLLIAPKK